jgi:acetyltransferase-like isoleucine patch superfamily enzyme
VTVGHRLAHDWFPVDLPPSVEIGERSWLYSSYAVVHCRSRREPAVRIGSDTGVYNGTQFDLGPEGTVDIGDFCTIVGMVVRSNGRVEVGSHTFVSHEVVAADSQWAVPPDGRDEPPAPAIVIGAGAWIGARAVLLPGAQVGDGAIVGAGAVVDGRVPDAATAYGNPFQVRRA